MIIKISKNLYKVFDHKVMDMPVYLNESELRDCFNALYDCGLIPNS